MVNVAEFNESHPGAFWFWAIIMLIQTPVTWAGCYGLWSFILWLFRLITLNRSKKGLWNRCASVSMLLAFLAVGILTNHRYWDADSLKDANKAIAEGIVLLLPSAIFVFYGMLAGLSYLWQL